MLKYLIVRVCAEACLVKASGFRYAVNELRRAEMRRKTLSLTLIARQSSEKEIQRKRQKKRATKQSNKERECGLRMTKMHAKEKECEH